MSKIHELNNLGQSIWYDNIRRGLITDGGMQKLIDIGVVGVTSNPSIFEKAIAKSDDYDDDLQQLVQDGKNAGQIYEALAIEDIANTADLLYPVYEETNGLDGYVSLEVDPTLAHDTEGTISEARRLFATLGRPNVMIKVPATPEGVPAIETLIGDGININVTLLFSNDNYRDVALAYKAGLEQLAANGGDLSRVASVASFFVSRVDSMVDKALEAIDNKELQGKIAIANAKIAYTIYEDLFSGNDWQQLVEQGARPQRLLWASTSTKNPNYPDVLYLDELIGPDTVNTVPPSTLDSFIDHGTVEITLTVDVDEARRQINALPQLGVDLDNITAQLQADGVASFAKAFESLMQSIESKRRNLLAQRLDMQFSLGEYEALVESGLQDIRDKDIVDRIWSSDHTVWKPEPGEITNRLGWLDVMTEMENNIPILKAFVSAVQSDGYTTAVLLGMGGSSLAPEVFSKTFGVQPGYLNLIVLDSTDPGAVLRVERQIDLDKTLFIVATKSGGTAETLSFFKYFYNQVANDVGQETAGEHFAAITDPGSSLVDLAEKYNFRTTFLNNPNIGGRYSALSYFGLVAASLLGIDLESLLDSARIAACSAGGQDCIAGENNIATKLGVAMGELALAGRDKLTLVSSPRLASFGDWVEQLIAESTGKEGKGILPVVGEEVGAPDVYGPDRFFIHLHLHDDDTYDQQVQALQDAGHPVVRVPLHNLNDLGALFFIFEFATVVAGQRLSIQPFDQPNVEAAKVMARQMIAAYEESGNLPEEETIDASPLRLQQFCEQARPGDYIALQAYVNPTEATDKALAALRNYLRSKTRLAVTVGYGPRFLHSTGQLHKGDGGNGLFVQMTAAMPEDAAIPDEAGKTESSMTFGVLKESQALGDGAALRQGNRRVIHFDLGDDAAEGIRSLM
ncbi:MAG: bifunctional transaldolase/phosoglucose isomerase [Candidatus Promineifilaceae bacterium]|nr:bifunctional transaldolase/phosoglucose isomerase [Candidatus Promineifilaceae bacterium]